MQKRENRSAGIAKSLKSEISGFSLVELMAGLLAASVLALTAGTMVFHAYDAWTDNHAAVNLQRDGRYAMDLITRAIRDAASSNIVTAVNNNLVIDNVMLNNQGVAYEVRFRRSGRNLIYDPDTSTGGDDVLLINDGVRAFTVRTTISGMIAIVLNLEQDDESIRFDSMTGFRN